MESLSEKIRTQGKGRFAEMTKENLSEDIYVAKARQTIMDFTLAIKAAESDKERSFSYQNLAVACATTLEKLIDPEKVKSLARATLLNFSHAYYYGSQSQPKDWIEGLIDKAYCCFDIISEKVKSLGGGNQNSFFQALNEVTSPAFPDIRLQLCFDLALSGYMQAQIFYTNKAYSEAEEKLCEYPKFIGDCYRFLNGSTARVEMSEKLEDLVKSHEMLVIYSLSMKEICAGDRLITKATVDPANKLMPLTWEAINSYHLAISITKERCLENEAIATGKIGKAYFKGIQNNQKAKEYSHSG